MCIHSSRVWQKVYKSQLFPACTSLDPTAVGPASSPFLPPLPSPILLKHRFAKAYRHPTLDALLTKQRLSSEARALVRCAKMGVTVPGLRLVDVKQGLLGMDWVQGWSVREVLGGGQDDDERAVGEAELDEHAQDDATDEGEDVQDMLQRKGVEPGTIINEQRVQ